MVRQGTRLRADKNKTALKWTIVGVPKAAPASAAPGGGRSARRVSATNCSPTRAAAAEPTSM